MHEIIDKCASIIGRNVSCNFLFMQDTNLYRIHVSIYDIIVKDLREKKTHFVHIFCKGCTFYVKGVKWMTGQKCL